MANYIIEGTISNFQQTVKENLFLSKSMVQRDTPCKGKKMRK